MIWHTYMTQALAGHPVEQFDNPGTPPFERWCGRYQFALTWRNARPSDDKCTTKTHSTKTKTRRTTTTIPTTTHVKPPKPPKPPPPPPLPPTTTTETTTTEPTTTTEG
jgi:hypothetical protein